MKTKTKQKIKKQSIFYLIVIAINETLIFLIYQINEKTKYFQIYFSFLNLQKQQTQIDKEQNLIQINFKFRATMSLKQFRMIKDSRTKCRHQLYRKVINVKLFDDRDNCLPRYLVLLNTHANINCSLIDNFLLYFDSIFEQNSGYASQTLLINKFFNKFFSYLLKLFLLHDKYLCRYIKSKDENIILMQQLNMDQKVDEGLKQKIKDEFNKSKTFIQQLYSQELIKQGHNNKSCDTDYRLKLKIIYRLQSQLRKQVIQQILNIQQKNKRIVYIPLNMESMAKKYLQSIADKFEDMQPIRKYYRSIRFDQFIEKRYSKFFLTDKVNFQNTVNRQLKNRQFVIKRYTNNNEEVLINFKDLVSLRKSGIKYHEESFQISALLLKELKKHKKQTGIPYPLLDLSCALFNQFSLSVQLNYQNPLFQSLGLLKRPTNLQNTLCFKATPNPFDTFSCYNEFTNPQMFFDVLIGMEQQQLNKYLYYHNRSQLKESMNQIKKQFNYRSQAWRYLMVTSYIMNGKEYYLNKGKQSINLKQFRQFSKQELEKITQDGTFNNCYDILGSQFQAFSQIKADQKTFQLKIQAFDNFFRENVCDDSIIETMGMVKVNSYLKYNLQIVKQLIHIVEKHPKMQNISNPVKHIYRFYVGAFIELLHIKIINQYIIQDIDKGLKILETVKNKVFIQKKNSNTFAQISYKKMMQYEQRCRVSKQAYLCQFFQKHIKIYSHCNLIFKVLQSSKQKLKAILNSENQLPTKRSNKQQRITIIKSIQADIQQPLSLCQQNISNIVFGQLAVNISRCYKNQSRYIIKKIFVLINLLFYCNRDNFVIADSLIIPIMDFTYSKEKNSSMRDEQNKNDSWFNQKIELLNYSLQILKDQAHKYGKSAQLLQEKLCQPLFASCKLRKKQGSSSSSLQQAGDC